MHEWEKSHNNLYYNSKKVIVTKSFQKMTKSFKKGQSHLKKSFLKRSNEFLSLKSNELSNEFFLNSGNSVGAGKA